MDIEGRTSGRLKSFRTPSLLWELPYLLIPALGALEVNGATKLYFNRDEIRHKCTPYDLENNMVETRFDPERPLLQQQRRINYDIMVAEHFGLTQPDLNSYTVRNLQKEPSRTLLYSHLQIKRS